MNKKVLIIAGGTGGHIYPGLAIAEVLKEHNIAVEWLGGEQGLESRIVKKAGLPFHQVNVKALRKKGIRYKLYAIVRLFYSTIQAIKIIRSIQPDLVLAMGGYVSGPGGIATWLSRKPLVVHEQNAVFGLTNRILSHFAKKVLLGFPLPIKKSKYAYVGNPVRHELFNLTDHNRNLKQPLNLLIFGGSQGALSFNELIPKALSQLPENSFSITHQAGQKHLETAKLNYHALSIKADVVPYIDDMRTAYQWADLVICRAGALTVAEMAAAGKAAIFIPYPYAVDDHQTKNAQFLTDHEAGLLLPHHMFTPETLSTMLRKLIDSPETIKKYAANAAKMCKDNAAKKAATLCLEIIKNSRNREI